MPPEAEAEAADILVVDRDPSITHFGMSVVWVVASIRVGGWPALTPRPALPGMNILLSGPDNFVEYV